MLKQFDLNSLKFVLQYLFFCHFLSFLNKFSYFCSRIV